MDLFNCPNITIIGSTFFHNRGTGKSSIPFRANTGAVAIGFDNIKTDIPNPTLSVKQCNFTNNQALAESNFRTTSDAFFNGVFTGRGGGLGVFINESFHNITGRIVNNSFVDNYAESFGGGLYLVVYGDRTQTQLLVERNVFLNNVGYLGGGALLMSFFSVGVETAPHQTTVIECSFINNSGQTGGAILAYWSYGGKLAWSVRVRSMCYS